MDQITAKYETGLKASLMDPEEAAAYLDSALEENDQEVFLLSLRDIADAMGFSKGAKDRLLNRAKFYRMLSATGHTKLSKWLNVLKSFVPKNKFIT